jgi:hypothetical protein
VLFSEISKTVDETWNSMAKKTSKLPEIVKRGLEKFIFKPKEEKEEKTSEVTLMIERVCRCCALLTQTVGRERKLYCRSGLWPGNGKSST